jgi:hypothetical protein
VKKKRVTHKCVVFVAITKSITKPMGNINVTPRNIEQFQHQRRPKKSVHPKALINLITGI